MVIQPLWGRILKEGGKQAASGAEEGGGRRGI